MKDPQTTSRPTKRMLEFLDFMHRTQRCAAFPVEWSTIRKKAEAQGYIEVDLENRTGKFGFTNYRLSRKGVEAIHA